MNIIDCINSQCGARVGDCGCAAKVREVAAFLDGHAKRIMQIAYADERIAKAAADCRAMARKLRGET